MLKIGIVKPTSNGKHYHRFQVPFELLNDKAKVTVFDGFAIENLPQNYDVIILNGIFRQPIEILHQAKKKGVKIIWDVDDWIDLPKDHDGYDPFTNKLFKAQQLETYRLADFVWAASKKLAHTFKKSVYVPNCLNLDHDQWKQPKIGAIDLVWTGGSTHYAMIYNMANKLPPKATIVLGGYIKENQKIWTKLEEAYSNRLVKYHAAEAWAYGDIYKHAKVAIAPLKDTEFNSYRSNLKALEAAAYGLPIVCSDVEAYKDVPQLKGGFYKATQRLLQNESLRNEVADKLQAWANKEHNLTKINQIRWQTISI